MDNQEVIAQRRKNKKTWKSIVSVLACIVVFCTTYALILPAITMEAKTYCGKKEHSHGEGCYTTELTCTLSEGAASESHEHTENCYLEEKELICGQEERDGHTHTEECQNLEKNLVCNQEEDEEHVHTDACYEEKLTYVCGQEENTGHTHNDACYQVNKKLTCNLETAEGTSEHIHTESCYKKKFTCEEAEHAHTKICYSNKEADVETAAEWEKTLPEELTGVWAEDVLAVADSQLGYTESTKNYVVDNDGKVRGYSRYGDWYGDPYGHWCAMFVSFCLNYAEVDKELMPQDANCQNWIETLSKEKYERYHKAEEYEPVPGDLIFFNFDEDEASDHVGLVVEVIEATKTEKAQVKTIEGNSIDNNVRYLTYDLDDDSIMGYGQLPKNPDEEVMEVTDTPMMFALNRGSSLTGIWANDILTIAKGEVGYIESGTPKYGSWGYGFVNYCLTNANISTEDIPRNENLATWVSELKENGLYRVRGDGYEPKPGDIVFINQYWGNENVTNVGVVSEIDRSNIYNPALIVIQSQNNSIQYVRYADGSYQNNGNINGYLEVPKGELLFEDAGVAALAKFSLSGDKQLIGANLVIRKMEATDSRNTLVAKNLCPAGSEVRNNHYYEIYFEKNGSRINPSGNVIIELSFIEPLSSNKDTGENYGDIKWNFATINSNDTDVTLLSVENKEANNDSNLTTIEFNYSNDPVYVFAATQEIMKTLSVTEGNITATAIAKSTVLTDDMQLVVTILNSDENADAWVEKLKEKHVETRFLTAGNQFFKVEIKDSNGELVEFPEDAEISIVLDFSEDVVPSLEEGKQIESGEWKLNTITQSDSEMNIGDMGDDAEANVVVTEALALDKITMLYRPHEVIAATAVVVDPDYTEKLTVSTYEELENAIQNAGFNKTEITIEADFESTGTISIPSNKKIEIDLNGHTVSVKATLFAVEGGQLILKDSKQNEETVTTSDKSVTGNQAVYNSSDEKLTYHITKSTIIDTSVGSTSETLETHTVVLNGKVDGSSSDQPIIKVTNGTFEQQSGALVGAKNRAIAQSGGTLNLKGGYICGNTAAGREVADNIWSGDDKVAGGAIYTSGSSTINLSGTVLAANTVTERGGAIAVESDNGATINITGGVISGNACTSDISTGDAAMEGEEQQDVDHGKHIGGGGIFVDGNVKVNMSDGYITNNVSKATGYFDGGGGIFFSGNSSVTLDGGYVTGNYAESGGGGIRSDFYGHHTTFYFKNGFVSANHANLAEGGGISINWDGVAYISGGYVTNNSTNTKRHWGGGGLFVSNGASMYVVHALVTDNHAGGFGGGLAGCSTGRVFLITNKGGAIYDNIAEGTTVTIGSEKAEDKIYGLYNPIFMNSGFNDYFCALTSTVEGNMLGGGAANWKGSADEVPITIGKDESHTASYVMGLTADPSQESIDAAIEEARITNGIYIHNNDSHTHGGGILCNGYLIVGNTEEIEVGTSLELSAKKSLLNEKEEKIPLGQKDEEGNLIEGTLKEFKFYIVDESDTVVSTGKNDADGNITFSARMPFKKTGTFVYYVYEDTETNSEGYLMDTRRYKVTVRVDVEASDKDGMTKKQYKITHVKIERNLNGEWELFSESDIGWKDEYEYSPVKMDLTGGSTFTNYELNSGTTKVTVNKKWTGTTPENTSVNVTLYQGDEVYSGPDATVPLNSDNNWTYTWNELPRSNKNGEKYVYSVREVVPDGYKASYEIFNEVSTNCVWVPLTDTELKESTEYILVSPDGSKALYLTAEHADKHLTGADQVNVTKGKETVIIDDNEYTDYYPGNTISERSIYRAATGWLNSGVNATIMQNKSTASALLIEPSNGLNLKDGTGLSGGWVSAFYLSDGMLIGYEKWDISENTNKYIICYDAEAGKFEALPLNDENKSKAAKLYVKIQSDNLLESETTIVITNTKNDEVTYGFNVTKVSDEHVGNAEQGTQQNIPLAGAKFEVRTVSGEVLRFNQKADGVYEWYSGTLTDEAIASTTTELITNSRGKLSVSGLPADTYTLVETEAPNGYELANPETIVLGSSEEENSIRLTIVDKKTTEGAFELPETGGPGTNVYIAGGILLLMVSVLLYIKGKNQKKGGQVFN